MAEKTRKTKEQDQTAPEVSPGFAHIPVSCKTGVFRSTFPSGIQQIPGHRSEPMTFTAESVWEENTILRVLSTSSYASTLLLLPKFAKEGSLEEGNICQVAKLYDLPEGEIQEEFLKLLASPQVGEEAAPQLISSRLSEGRGVLLTPYISLPSLESLIAAQAPYSEHEALYIIYTISKLLDLVREKYSLIHGRLKPSKILFSRSARPKFLGLGLGDLLRQHPVIQKEEKLFYMSPEYIKGEPLSWQSDMYSLGIILFRLLTGVLPFYSSDREELKDMHTSAVLPFPSDRNQSSKISPRTWSVLSRMTMKIPSQRFATPEKYFDALIAADKALEELPVPAEKSKTTTT